MFKQSISDLLFHPAEVSTGGTLTPMSKEDLFDQLMKDDEPEVIDLNDPNTKTKEEKEDEKDNEKEEKEVEVKDDEEKDDEEKEEVDELKELEEELKEPSEDKLELMTPARRADILKKHPNIFKDFPYLETAYYRDQKFTELFPTIKEAEQAVETLRSFEELQNKLQSGDFETTFKELEKDEQAFGKFVDNYLPVLAKVNPNAYHHVLGNVFKDTVQEMLESANSSNNDSLKNAAVILHQFIFGNTKFVKKQPFIAQNSQSVEKKQADDELAKRERAFNERQFNIAQKTISSKVDNAIKATIEQHMDPKGEMTDYIKNTAIEKALNQVGDLIGQDTRFKQLLDKLWENAAKKDFASTEMDKIKSACISKARTLLPSVIKMARRDALKGMGKRVREEEEKQETDTTTKRESAPPQNRGNRSGDKSGPRSDESSLDYLMRDV